MDPFEKQSHVNKLFKKELIVAILWNARRSTESRALVTSRAYERFYERAERDLEADSVRVRKNFGLA
jgi:hypothetical protein